MEKIKKANSLIKSKYEPKEDELRNSPKMEIEKGKRA